MAFLPSPARAGENFSAYFQCRRRAHLTRHLRDETPASSQAAGRDWQGILLSKILCSVSRSDIVILPTIQQRRLARGALLPSVRYSLCMKATCSLYVVDVVRPLSGARLTLGERFV